MGVLLEDVVAPGTGRVLQPEDRLGIEQVRLALAAPLILTTNRKRPVGQRDAIERVRRQVPLADLLSDLLEGKAPNPAAKFG